VDFSQPFNGFCEKPGILFVSWFTSLKRGVNEKHRECEFETS